MKKIVFVIESLHCGGAEKSLVTLLQNFDLKKFNVDLIITIDNGDFQKFVPKEVNIKVINVFSNLNKPKRNFLRFLLLLRKKLNWNKKYHVAQLYWKTFGRYINIETNEYDIAIAYNQGLATYFVAEKIIAKTKFSWLNTDYNKAGYNIFFDKHFYKKFNKIVCVSKENEMSFKKELNKFENNATTIVIKDIIDSKIIKQLSLEIDDSLQCKNQTILTVGRLAEAKGLGLAIKACKILISKGYKIKWFIIGEGPKRSELENLIKENNLENDFILLGYKENPYPYIKSCDIYAQTSLFEGLGLTVIEAAILQKPIITTNFPTAFTIINNEETGLICEMTPIAIANSIERYMIDSDLKNRVVKNLSLVKNNDKETSLKKINELLNS